MRFPLADWIDAHADCRFDLGTSGMRGSIPAPRWPTREPPASVAEELRAELADHLGVARTRLFLSHGASEANAWILGFLARQAARRGRAPRARVRFPEYPPLFDAAAAFGYAIDGGRRPAEVAVLSNPRNPEGDLWPAERLRRFAEGSRAVLVDETFREFVGSPSVASRPDRKTWATGTFTKFFGADDVRVGYAVAPPDSAALFNRYVGLVSDKVAPRSLAAALGLLRDLPRVRARVRAVVDRNARALAAALPGVAAPAAPVHFDRPDGWDGDALARACLRRSVLVSPGSFFGAPDGVRLCLTRRNAPEALRRYAAVRGRRSARAERL
jgi:histidinol-phosphate/aromatic aminotransferase/cobyric acid decarboxylase-like protein